MKKQNNKQTTIKLHLFIFVFSILQTINCFGQEVINNDPSYIYSENGNKVLLTSLGKTTMYLKSGGPKTKCTIMKIGVLDIEFLKDGSLHNILIEKIKRIVPDKYPDQVIYFDAEHKPFISSNSSAPVKKQEVLIPLEAKKEPTRQGNDLLIMKNGDSIFCTILRQSSMYIFYVENSASKTIAKSELSKFQSLTPIPKEATDSTKFVRPVQVFADMPNTIKDPIDTNSKTALPKADTLYLRSGEKLLVRITEIGITSITYTKNNSYKHVVQKNDAEKVVLSSGYVEEFPQEEIIQPKKVNYYALGRSDGETYFNAGPAMAAGVVSSIFLYFGLILVAIVAAIPPLNLYNPANPNNHLLSSNSEYARGYKNSAHRKKARRVFGGFLIGILIIALVFLALIGAVFL